ncbi:TPA: hypothetical protein QEM53_003742 [Pseudomonas putida]|uniref:hypothetical protein n=1 Tax=Pseudomonas putida TaxID=303 RepID=UPI00235DAE83|nr:hypothetical protein [Pseudomonas putida]GLO19230.1 hypothetical protein PPUJ20188_26260 [Pseudomonas putida]HDS0995030.1 hypothetical protein [Pseudomonas putida]HDS1762833.1 hypothetical protein [Pseudomonas putida]
MSWDCFSFWIEHHPGLASWVQALGSIASIWAAFLIGNKQIQKQNKVRNEERQAKLAAFYAVIRAASQNALTFAQLLNAGNSLATVEENWRLIFSSHFKTSQRAIANLPSHELGTYNLVESFHSLAGAIDQIAVIVEGKLASGKMTEEEFISMRADVLVQCRVCGLSWERFELACKGLNHGWKSRVN